MKQVLIILLVAFSFDSFGQIICPCDSFDFYWGGDTINMTSDNKKQGLWIHYDRLLHSIDGIECKGGTAVLEYKILSKGYYLDNHKNGTWIYYHNDTLISRSAKYIDGKLDSIDTSFGLNGKVLSRTHYDMGEKGLVIVYYETGKLKYKGLYHSDKLTSFEIYYPDGKLKYEANEISRLIANDLKYYNQFGEQVELKDKDISRIGLVEDLIMYLD